MTLEAAHPAEEALRSSSEPQELRPLPDNPEALIPASSLPGHIGIARQTLARWRHEGYGPPYVKLGRRVFYRSGDIKNWVAERSRLHLSPSQ